MGWRRGGGFTCARGRCALQAPASLLGGRLRAGRQRAGGSAPDGGRSCRKPDCKETGEAGSLTRFGCSDSS